jgi:hypothetical protein
MMAEIDGNMKWKQPYYFTLVSCLAYSSTLKMEEIYSFGTGRHYTPEDKTLHNHSSENLKSYRPKHLLELTIFIDSSL